MDIIQQIADRFAIEDLVYRYAQNIRMQREMDNADVLTEDAVFEFYHAFPDNPTEGRRLQRLEGAEAIIKSFEGSAGQGTRIWPMLHNLRVRIDGDEATGTCVMMSAIWPHGNQMVGEYRDRFRRTPDGWRFSERAYFLFGESDGTYAAEAFKKYAQKR